MKRIFIFSIFFALLSGAHANKPRVMLDFNLDWKFKLGEQQGAENPDYDDANWRTLNLPHDWSIEQGYTTEHTAGSTGFLPTGEGWYRKTFTVDSTWRQGITHIEFDGVFSNAEVWINGKYLGKRPYGYSPFEYDLSKDLNYEGNNVLSVRADNKNYANSRWYTGSGIYRNVRLVHTNKVYIPRFGLWAETPLVNEHKAQINIHAIIKTKNELGQAAKIVFLLKDASNKVLAKTRTKLTLTGQDTVDLTRSVNNPSLWSIAATNMYTAEVHVRVRNELVDIQEIEFGIRDIKFDANKGFFLNGSNIKLKGVCLHHDAGAVGAVFIEDVWRRRLSKLKEIGVNAIRMSHNPADPGLLKLCDELGFVVISEAFDEWKRNKNKWITSRFAHDMRPELETGYGTIFEDWAEQDVKDMVRSSRNHPSIIMWSMGNEIEWTYPYYWKMSQSNQGLGNQVLLEETGDTIDELKETAELIQSWIKEVDGTRYVTSGGVLPKSGNITGYFDVPDVMGYNYRAQNYDEDHKTYPNRIIYGSENWGTYAEWKAAEDRDFIAGIFIWTGIAYLGESGPFPWKGLEISLLDFAGFYTPRGHFYQTLWNDEPSIYAATKLAQKADWRFRNGHWKNVKVANWLDKWLFEDVESTWNYNKGDSVFVEVYSNSPEVELFVNDKSFGKQRPEDFEDHIVKFVVPYSEGALKAVGLSEGERLAEYELSTSKWVNKLVLKADRDTMSANGLDVVHIEAFLMGNSGHIVPDKQMQIEFKVEGQGVNIGVDNGWDHNVQKHKSNQIVTHNGKALLLVQSTRNKGAVVITARSGKLESNEIIVTVE